MDRAPHHSSAPALLERPPAAPPPARGALRATWLPAWLASWVLVAAVTLVPVGNGWSWGSPTAELRWYLTGLGSASTLFQLVGNLALLAALAVTRWPRLGRLVPLAAAGLLAGSTIEVLQWVLPLGRVVSPLDAVLNATGAVVAGLLVSHVRATSASRT